MSIEALLEQGHRGVLRLCLADETGDGMHEEGAAEFPGMVPQIKAVCVVVRASAINVSIWQGFVNDALREIVSAGGDVSDIQITPLDGGMLLATIFYWAKPQEAAQPPD